MQAVQVTRFGGPEVLELVDLEPARGRTGSARRRHAGRRQLRRHPSPPTTPTSPAAAAVRARAPRSSAVPSGADGRRGRRAARGAAGTPSRRSLTRRASSRCPTRSPTPPRSPWCCRARPPGTCCGRRPGSAPARASSCTPRRAASAASPSSWPGSGAPGGSSRPGRRGQARAGAVAGCRRRRRRRRRARRTRSATCCATPTRAADVDVVLEMTGGHVFDGSLAALAPLGRLAVYGLASRTAPASVARRR